MISGLGTEEERIDLQTNTYSRVRYVRDYEINVSLGLGAAAAAAVEEQMLKL